MRTDFFHRWLQFMYLTSTHLGNTSKSNTMKTSKKTGQGPKKPSSTHQTDSAWTPTRILAANRQPHQHQIRKGRTRTTG